MIEIKIEGVDRTTRYLTDVERKQVPFALSRAINASAKDVQKAQRGELEGRLDRPKPYTLGGTYIQYSNKANLTATIGLIDKPKQGNRAPVKYLAAQIGGGHRRFVGYERALQRMGLLPNGYQVVPGQGAKLDRFGNLDAKQMNEVFGALKSKVRNLRVYTGKGKRAYAAGYFVSMPGNPKTSHLEPGVYKRVERARDSQPVPLLIFVKTGDYKKRLDLIAPSREAVQRGFNQHFAREFALAMKSAR